ncbi:dephospho-CoA kinase [Paenibacillus sp. GCM10023252]|uniref:dephospho-CoA kinase n=1 Tax=Paenibacillus sp. GCM10023252 TaxID=3252649 RepID=UPI003608B612
MRIGLTGGIASGKSTVGAMLAELGAFVVDADQSAREVVMPGRPALAAVASLFGQAVLASDGTLDRKALGEIVFHNPKRLKQLEEILHPAIRSHMQRQMLEYEEQHPEGLVVADIPLLYETGQYVNYEGVLLAYVPRELQVKRLMDRNAMPLEEAERRVALQMDIEEKKLQADWVIDNSGTLQGTREQVEAFYRERVR